MIIDGFNKKGVSAVVATVLIVMITVAAIGIIWITILPTIRDNLAFSDVCENAGVSIISSQGYTCYLSNNITMVQVSKSKPEVNLTGLKFSISSEGNSYDYEKQEVAYSTAGYNVYYLNTSEFEQIEKISVVPIIRFGDSEKSCSVISLDNVPSCSASVNLIRTSPIMLIRRSGSYTTVPPACDNSCSCADSKLIYENCTNDCGNVCPGTKRDGSILAPFAIYNWTDLNNVRNNLSANYILMRNLISSDFDYENIAGPNADNAAGWVPLGNSTNSFSGNFNGEGYFIKDLYINRPLENFTGLFGAVVTSANVSNLNLANISVIGSYYVGGLVGYNSRGNIINCSSQGVVSGVYDVGGLVGRNYAGLVESSYSNITLLGLAGSPTSVFFGGLVGDNYAAGSDRKAYITNSYAVGTIFFSGTNNVVGGLTNIWTSQGSYSFVNNSYSTVNVSAVNGYGLIGGAAGIVTSSFWDVNVSNKTTSLSGLSKTTDEMKNITTFSAWDTNIWNLTDGEYPTLMWQN